MQSHCPTANAVGPLLLLIIISFLLCLIVALPSSAPVGFFDPGMPIFLREDNTGITWITLPSEG